MNRKHIPHPSNLIRLWIYKFLIPFILSLFLIVTPALATEEAPVSIDGRLVFQVGKTEQFTARERADLINFRLRQIVSSQELVQVTIQERNKSPTIIVNQKYLLTVTQADVVNNKTPEEQAEAWRKQLDKVLQQAQKERSFGFIRNALLLSIGVLIVAFACHKLLGWLWKRSREAVLQRLPPSPDEAEVDSSSSTALNLLFNFSLLAARIWLWVSVTLYITNLLPISRIWSYRLANQLIQSLTSPILTLGQTQYSVVYLLVLIAMLLGLMILAGAATNLLRTRILQFTGIDRGAQEAIAIITKYTMIFVGAIVLLQVWGLDLSSLTILASALGVGIGFGFQDIAKNFGSGVILLFERPIQVGDFVEVGDIEGTVERIGGRSTLLRTLDQISIIVPNSRFLEDKVINWSYKNPVSRLRIPVGVAYGSDISAVKKALLEAAQEETGILSFPNPTIFFIGFGDSSLNFVLLVWTDKPSQQYLIKSNLYFRIEEVFRQYHIQIPFPQRDLHIRSGNLPLELSPDLEANLRDLSEDPHNIKNK
ncbi:mechanosensitive ion channel family protein [Nodularia spumigena]|uniref:mechanosensitive ion channel family protein n=1 Tax=Nodularia spumigena TaxID=70799 RepID=UPI002330A6E5|nr:mechanosensitive ion channel domain-containing protein [Nodularia spumigena]MDB9321532.1 mechanosensitive ion channel [Nodularia spumigena CS-591/07A]MDB9349476.1 mechanosensitive ion channel [Nodularia spumigena CS-588/01]MDB9352026.1 mechanosensitive ion channel [Nodularia spumigena CS-588/05]